jgi:hypothetical protein
LADGGWRTSRRVWLLRRLLGNAVGEMAARRDESPDHVVEHIREIEEQILERIVG